MAAAIAIHSPVRHLQPLASSASSAGRRARGSCLAALSQSEVAVSRTAEPQRLTKESSNIVALPGGLLTEGQRRKAELQAQAQAALAAENSWWQDDADTPANLIAAVTPADFKRRILEAPATQLVVVDYLKPSCAACRRLYPKLKQIAAQNPDALFLKVNVDTDEMRELGQGMQVTHLPWFHLFRAGDLVASFSANIATVSQLRAEIAGAKPCLDPGCDQH